MIFNMDCCTCFSTAEDIDSDFEQLYPISQGPKFENVEHSSAEGAPTDKKWYHAKITDEEAERRLRQGSGGINGSYLVYDNPNKRGQYVLLVTHKGNLHRWRILHREADSKYILGKDGPGVEGYSSVRELIKAHRGIRGKPLKTERGISLKLSKEYVYVQA